MKTSIAVIGSVALIAATMFAAAIAGAFFGAVTGWCIEHTFLADFLMPGARVFGLEITTQMFPAIGAFLGFVGSFFKSTASHSKE